MSAEDEKEDGVPAPPEAAEEPKAAKKPAAKKAPAKKAPAKKAAAAAEGEAKAKPAAKKAPAKKAAEDEQAGKDGQQRTLKAPAKAKRAAKKAVEHEAAAPGSGAEAKEAAKAQQAERPSKKLARGVAAATKGRPTRRVVRAHARYVRTSARKARMVCGHLRGKSVQEARAILAFTPREVARDWSKLLESAVANAESNHELLGDDLIVREAYADEGPTIKRFRPRAMGRATPIRKRTSHLTITLTPAPENGSGRRKG
jgi:ribosomal protein L22